MISDQTAEDGIILYDLEQLGRGALIALRREKKLELSPLQSTTARELIDANEGLIVRMARAFLDDPKSFAAWLHELQKTGTED